MLKLHTRLLSNGRRLLNNTTNLKPAIPVISESQPPLTTYFAAKQFTDNYTTKQKAKKLRRREKKLKKKITKEVNILKQYDLKNVPFSVDPVLGNSNCKFIENILNKIDNQEMNLSYGIDRIEFEKVLYGAEKLSIDQSSSNETMRDSIKTIEEHKKKAIEIILNSRNTSAEDKRKLATKYAVEEMQINEGDTASPEVVAGVLTTKIYFMMQHVKKFKKDVTTRVKVEQLVHQRQSILKYLKKISPERYYYTLAKLGLSDDVIIREFAMSKQYLQDFKVWGDKQLVKETKSMKVKNEKVQALRDRIDSYNDLAKQNYELLYGKK
ncbi:unnamed protein product [Candida verbasci]|uniref:37S ribosomal protein S28, mitochondrial n=1 Tax=Candida verbasci TaxID=1227364 RepID=A0A9W4TU43_9ASCO|nr:unnamed protein product [Candida verbasci]